jgi:hypothetical protein
MMGTDQNYSVEAGLLRRVARPPVAAAAPTRAACPRALPAKVEEEQVPQALHLAEDAEEEEAEEQVPQKQEQLDRLQLGCKCWRICSRNSVLEREREREHDRAAEQVHKGYIRKTLWASP